MADPRYQTKEYRTARANYTRDQRLGTWLTCHQPVCLEPTRTITPDQPLDVAHDDTGQQILGPAHARCNRADGGRRRHQTTTPIRRELL